MKQVGRDLSVQYVLEGSVRRLGNRVRIAAQLVEADNGAHIWAEKYDRELAELFDVQDEVTRSVVASTQTQVVLNEGLLAEQPEYRLPHLGSYEKSLEGDVSTDPRELGTSAINWTGNS